MTRTLAGRVARAMVLATALGAAAGGAVANGLAWRWSVAREEARLRAAAATLAGELATGDPRAAADDEDIELRPSGIRVALFEGGRPVGGAVTLGTGPAGCAVTSPGGSRVRRCVVPHGRWTVVTAAPDAPFAETRRTWALASAVAALLAAIVAGAAGRAVAARVVSPLSRLRVAVGAARADAPDPAAVGAPEGYAEVDALRDALADLLARHADALARSRRFAADAAHELRTPLGTLRAELELALEAPDLPRDTASSLRRARATAVSMGRLAERLLVLASPLDGPPGDEAVSLADVAVAAVDAVGDPRVTPRAGDEGLVRGDAALLRALVDNAIDNARKFAPAGAIVVEVTAEGDRVVLRVADEGPGVPPASRDAVFAPFHRDATARASGAKGHGVGLALIAHVARAHGGSAAFEDASVGATLRVELPAWCAAAPSSDGNRARGGDGSPA